MSSCYTPANAAGQPTFFVTVGRNGRECTKPLCATLADECSQIMVGVKRNVAPTNGQMGANAIQVGTFFPHLKGGDGVVRDGKLVRMLMKAGVTAPDAAEVSEAVVVEGVWNVNPDGTFQILSPQGVLVTLGKMNVQTEDLIEGDGTAADPVAINMAKLLDALRGRIPVATEDPIEGDGTDADPVGINLPKLLLALNNNVKACAQEAIIGDGTTGNCFRLDGTKLVALIDQTLGSDCWRTAGCSSTVTPTPTPTPTVTPTPTPNPTPVVQEWRYPGNGGDAFSVETSATLTPNSAASGPDFAGTWSLTTYDGELNPTTHTGPSTPNMTQITVTGSIFTESAGNWKSVDVTFTPN